VISGTHLIVMNLWSGPVDSY